MEPERKIEKLLRAYAKRRRAKAGDPLKLHPATRRLMQGEVARNSPKPDEESASMTLWELFRQQWAFLLGFSLIVFFGAMLFLPTLSSAKKKAQAVTAMSNLKQIGMAAHIAVEDNNGKLPNSLDALTNELGSEKFLIDPESGKPFIYVAGGVNLDSLPSNSVLAYSPADNNGRTVLFANGDVQRLNDARLSELTNRGLSQLVAANDSVREQQAEAPAAIMVSSGNVAAAPPVSGQSKSADLAIADQNVGELAANRSGVPATSYDRLVAAQTNSLQFATAASQNLAFGLQNSFKNTSTPGNPAHVLANFQVQQNGNTIHIVDQDGSVYDGSLLPEHAVAQNEPVPVAMPAQEVTPPQIQNKDLSADKITLPAAQNNFFRVTGMNRTLKQNVVFIGNLLATSNATTNLQQTFGVRGGGGGGGGFGGGQTQQVLTNQLPWSSSRITGTAIISDTNQIEINAEPLNRN
jgi:hypothetical protein